MMPSLLLQFVAMNSLASVVNAILANAVAVLVHLVLVHPVLPLEVDVGRPRQHVIGIAQVEPVDVLTFQQDCLIINRPIVTATPCLLHPGAIPTEPNSMEPLRSQSTWEEWVGWAHLVASAGK